MNIVCICSTKNEGDIIEAFVRLNGKVCNSFFFNDDSTDNTREIISLLIKDGYDLNYLPKLDVQHNQPDSTRFHLLYVKDRVNPDWIFLLDADEIIVTEKHKLITEITSLPHNTLIYGEWRTYVPISLGYFKSASPLSECFAMLQNSYTNYSKVSMSGSIADKVITTPGNHTAKSLCDTHFIGQVARSYYLAHFPVRSSEQIVAKNIMATHNLSSRIDAINGEGFHVYPILQMIRSRQYSLTLEDLGTMAVNYGCGVDVVRKYIRSELDLRENSKLRTNLSYLDLGRINVVARLDSEIERLSMKIKGMQSPGSTLNTRNPLRSDKKPSYYAFARNEVVDAIVQSSIPARQILEIGCAGGATGKRIKELMPVQHYVGIEISEEAAAIARQHLDQVIVANIEDTDLSACGLVHESFDLILALDVLEHLYDPWDALSTLLGYLKPGGHVVASIPNIQNVSILRNLLKGVWKYEDAGILDATHLRFFTFDQISELFSGAGLTISRIDSILNPPIDVNTLHAAGNSFSLDKVHFTDLSKEEIVRFYTYQYLVIAQKGSGVADEQTSPKPVTPVLNAYPIGSSAPKPQRAVTPEPLSKPGKELAHGMVSIVILTFNQLKYTKECIESIRRHTPEAHEIIFVDNGSTDGTVKWLKKLVMENPNYSLIENGKNLGFAKGCNQGIEAASGEYILLLNNDVVVTEDWLSGMMACLNSAPDAGIVGPMTNSISGPQKVETVGYSTTKQLEDYSKDFREQNRHRRIPIRRVVGFCMLFKHALVEQIGLLDESFGSGNFEDDDFCLRATLEGFRNLIAGDVFIHHYGSRSFIGNKIDYGSAMSKNKKLFSEKWTGIDGSSPLGRKILTVGAMERASEFHQQDQIDKAIESALKAIGHSPDEKRTYHALAELLIDAKRFADAIEALSEMPTDDQDSRRLELIGYCKEGLELYSEAEDFADRALALNPASASALNLKGILAYKREDKDASEAHFQKAILCDPGYGEPYSNLGVLKWAAGNTEKGFNLLERGFILSPTVMDIATLYHSALTADAAFERAERIFRDANTLHPASRRLKFLLIDILLQQGKFEEAMQLVEGAMIAFGTDDGIVSAALAIRDKIGAKKITRAPKNKGTLSLCMIVKDEEEYLPKCLASVKSIVDEMIIVDTGSTDRTVDIAKAFGAQVYDFEWTNSFSEARNFSLSKASGDWVLVLDGDEVISPMDHRLLANLVRKKSSKPIAYSFDTRNYIYATHVKGWTGNDGKYAVEEAGTGWSPSRKVRLFINNKLVRFEGVVHELLEHSLTSLGIPIRYCNIPIHHYGHLNVQDNISKGKAYYALGKDKLAGKENDFQALVELARQANELGEYENAIELWQKVIDLNPNYVDGFLNLGFSHIQLDQYEAALAASEKAITLDPSLKEVVLNYSNCQMVIGDAKKAIAVLENLFEKEPEYPAAMGVIAAAYFIDHQKDKGLEYLDKIRKKGYDGARTLYVYAKKLVSTGRTNDAILLLEPAQDQNVLDKDVFSLLLECYKARNDAAQSPSD